MPYILARDCVPTSVLPRRSGPLTAVTMMVPVTKSPPYERQEVAPFYRMLDSRNHERLYSTC